MATLIKITRETLKKNRFLSPIPQEVLIHRPGIGCTNNFNINRNYELVELESRISNKNLPMLSGLSKVYVKLPST